MNRWTALKGLAPTLALLAAMAPAPVSATGGPVAGFVIPAGTTADFTGVEFGACNNLGWGYQLNLGPELVQASRQGDCVHPMTAPSVHIGPFATPMTLRIFLKDITCSATYFSDGTPVDHVIISGSNPYLVRFADAGGFCEKKFTPVLNFTGQNFKVTLTLTDLCKVEDMDSSLLDLACEQEGADGDGDNHEDGAGHDNHEDGAGHDNHADASVQPLKATEHRQHGDAHTSPSKVGQAKHADERGEQSKEKED